MPLTLSHPALVLPLRRLGLPTTALVLGSMVPDGPLFVGWVWGYDLTHSVLGAMTVDVAATLLLLGAWTLVLRDPLVDLSPGPVRSRLAPRVRMSGREWVLAPVAAVLGSLTHLAWDAFTHGDRWGAEHIAWLREEHAGILGYRLVQHVSGVVGLAIVLAAALLHLRGLAPGRPRPPAALSPAWLGGAGAVPLLAGGIAALTRVGDGLVPMAFDGVITTLLVSGPALVGVCLAWHLARRGTVGRGRRA